MALAEHNHAPAPESGHEPDASPAPRLDGAEESSALVEALAGVDLAQLAGSVAAELDERGVTFGAQVGGGEFKVDPVPRLISAAEWELLRRGLIQRVQALDAFVDDVYGERQIIAAGVVPLAALTSAEHFEQQLMRMSSPPTTWIGVAGLDLVRDTDGHLKVLEDNVRTPSGLAYAVTAREVLAGHVTPPSGLRVRSLDGAFEMLGRALRAAAPDRCKQDPSIVVLTDGPHNSAFYEHHRIARELGVPLVTPADMTTKNGGVRARVDRRSRPVDVVYRRTDEDRLFAADGRATAMGELLFEPWSHGRIGCVNAFGTGVADDKLMHSYVDQMITFYLGQEPLLESVHTYDLTQPDVLEMVLGRIGELVIKPRSGHGGVGIVVCPHAQQRDVDRVAAAVAADPQLYIAQELVMLSQHPTVCDGRLEPRHIDLRPYVMIAGGQIEVIPGGLTRVSFEQDGLVVNSSQNGGAKDTWVLA